MSMYEFKLPDIGEGIVEAEILEWRVDVGDTVEEDQVLAELMTDKATIEIPSPRRGRIARLRFEKGDIVPVGAVLLEIDVGGEEPAATGEGASREDAGAASTEPTTQAQPTGRVSSDASPRLARPESRERPASEAASAPKPASAERTRKAADRRKRTADERASRAEVESPPPPGEAPTGHPPRMPARPGARQEMVAAPGGRRIEAVPAVRELAKRLGVKLEEVFGTGPNGRIMRRDIERHVELSGRGVSDSREPPLLGPARAPATTSAPPRERAEEPADPDDWERIPIRGVRRITAERMHRSKSTAAHFTYVEEIDMTEVEAKRKELEPEGHVVSPLAFIAFAAVKALPAFPLLNASLDDERGEIVLKRRIHLGIATATDEGLLVPVVRDAQLLSFFDLAAAIRELADGARKRSLPPAALTGGTFTITSLGKLGGVLATPVINHPESAILSVHAIRELPRYVDGELRPRAIMNLAISLDHRIVDGIECARFVREVKRHLESADLFTSLKEESNRV